MSRPLIKSENVQTQCKTFNEWNKKGYYVTKGSKAVGRNNEGECVFSNIQVAKPLEYASSGTKYYMDDEDAWEMSDLMGLNSYEGPGFF